MNKMSNTIHEANATSGSTMVHTAVGDNVTVKSAVSAKTQSKTHMENTQKMEALMNKLGTTHQQIDEYSRRRTEQISEEVTAAINRVVAETQQQQSSLLADANVCSAAIEEDYQNKLQQLVAELATVKAQNLTTLEKDLNVRQEIILEAARKRIDDLNQEGNRLKFGVLREAQAQANAKVESITEQMAMLGSEDASRLLTSTATTLITTESKLAGENHLQKGSAVADKTTKTDERSSMSSSHSTTSATNKT